MHTLLYFSTLANDNGPGPPEENLPFLIDRFQRNDKSHSRMSTGSGAGLAIANKLIEVQGGTITAMKLIEKGSQIIVEL
jgi:signal transduction histidine kinase